jgi:hypothetical protein
MDVLNQQSKVGALKNLAQRMRSGASQFKPTKINTNISARTKMEEDPDYKRKQLTPLTGKVFTPTRAPAMPKL